MSNTRHYYGPFFRFTRRLVRIFSHRITISNANNIIEPAVYISHHGNMYGPATCLMWIPFNVRLWSFFKLCYKDLCYAHYCEYTFTKRYGWNKLISSLIALPMSRLAYAFFTSIRAIPVYRGKRDIVKTFNETIDALVAGENIILFPDIDYANPNPDVEEIYNGFLFIERYYFKKTGKHIPFVPLYSSKNKKTIVVGEPLYFKGERPFAEESTELSKKMVESLNKIAKECGDI